MVSSVSRSIACRVLVEHEKHFSLQLVLRFLESEPSFVLEKEQKNDWCVVWSDLSHQKMMLMPPRIEKKCEPPKNLKHGLAHSSMYHLSKHYLHESDHVFFTEPIT